MEVSQAEKYRRYRRYFVDLSRFYRKKKVRVYTGIVLSLLTTTFFLFFALRPTFVTIASLIKEIKDKRVIAQKLQDKIEALNSAQIEYQRIQKDLPLINEALPTNPNLSLFVRQLETLAGKNQVAIKTFQLKETTLKSDQPPTNQSTGFVLVAFGSYQNLKSFLGSLTNFRRLISIQAFGFQTNQEGENLTLNLDGQIYYLTEE